VRLLHFADLHLDTPFRWAGAERARRRRHALRTTLRRIVDLAHSCRVDAVLCAGDLYEQDSFTPDTAAFVVDAFERLAPIPVYVAPGNHDWLGPESLYRQVRWPAHVHVFDADRLAPVPLAPGITLWGAAHLGPAGTRGFLRGASVDGPGIHLALFHGAEYTGGGEADPHAPFTAGELPEAGIHHAFCGHYHAPRDAPHHTYPGNPDPLTFGETGERGVVLATVGGDGSLSRERRRVASSLVHDIALDVSGCATGDDVRELVAGRLRGLAGDARVTLRGELQAGAEVQDVDVGEAAPWMDAVVPNLSRLGVAYDLEAIGREPTVRGEFVRALTAAAELDPSTRRQVLITGLRALDGRTDLEVW
jgi:DNA repair exonuclease SbcCD nuclease subunit